MAVCPRMTRLSLPLLVLSLVLFTAGAFAQAPPAATPAPQGGGSSQNWDQVRNMSREERMRLNRERIQRILSENEARKQQAAQATPAPQAAAPGTPATPAPPGQPVQTSPVIPPTAPPGAAVPTGPVQPFVPGQPPPTATPTPKPAAPEQARDQSRSLIYMTPMDSLVNVGDTFTVDIIADTKQGNTDDLRFLLCYPPNKLNPLAVDFSPVAGKATEEIAYDVNNQLGELWMRIPFKKAVNFPSIPVVTITWEALAPTEAGQLRFGFVPDNEEESTGMFLDGKYILGTEHDHMCGALDGTVVIRDPKSKAYVQSIGNRDLIISSTEYMPPPASMTIRLDTGGKTSVRVGDEFTVDLVLDNPMSRQLDAISAYVQFDPKVLQMVDTDRNNWIRDGFNAADAYAHSVFPFDYFRKNYADNEVGDFIYDSTTSRSPFRGVGSFAKLTFRAIATTERTDIVLVMNDPGFAPSTDVCYLKTSMMKDKPQKAGVLNGLSLSVYPGKNNETVASKTEKPKRASRATRSIPQIRGKRIF